MKPFAALLFVSILAVVATGGPGPETKDKKDRKPKFTISKETTYVTAPIDKDGYIDYAAALNERLRKDVTVDNNANVLIWKALGPRPDGKERMPAQFFRLMDMEEPPDEGNYFVDLRRFLSEKFKIDDPDTINAVEKQMFNATRYPWSANDHPQIAEWLHVIEIPLSMVVEASKRSHYLYPRVPGKTATGHFDGMLSVNLIGAQKHRMFANALCCRAMLKISDNKYDEAWQDLLACHRLARFVGRGGTLIEFLVGIAVDAIARNADLAFVERVSSNSKNIQQYFRELQTLRPMPEIADTIDLGERFMCLDNFRIATREGFKLGVAANALQQIDWDPTLRMANQIYDRMVKTLRELDRTKREKEFEQFEKEFKQLKKDSVNLDDAAATPQQLGKALGVIWLGLSLPAHRKVHEAADRGEQGQRNLYLAFALAAYQRDQGSYPKSLDALAPKYIAKIPDDLFTGKPLVYRPSEKGYLLYSFGPNGKDDEGRWYDDEPKGDDPNVRMPVPKPKAK